MNREEFVKEYAKGRRCFVGVNLTGADLTGADLRGAVLTDAVLTDAVLTGADLRGADLRGADLTDADLTRAVLTGADLKGADLRFADLTGAVLTWQSHALLGEILRREAKEDVARRLLAGLVIVSPDWCWKRFLSLDLPEKEWALDVLAGHVRDGDRAPDVLIQRREHAGTE